MKIDGKGKYSETKQEYEIAYIDEQNKKDESNGS